MTCLIDRVYLFSVTCNQIGESFRFFAILMTFDTDFFPRDILYRRHFMLLTRLKVVDINWQHVMTLRVTKD